MADSTSGSRTSARTVVTGALLAASAALLAAAHLPDSTLFAGANPADAALFAGADPVGPDSVGPDSVVTDSGPFVVEDFSSYRSTSELMSDPRGIYRAGADVNEEHIELDRTIGVAPLGLTQSMRYDFDAVKTVGRGIDLPGSGVYEVWIEAWVRFSENFRTDWGGVGPPAPAYKLLFAVTDPRRFGLATGLFGDTWTLETPPDAGIDQFGGSRRLWDGEWHRIRLHFAHESSPAADDGVVRFWIDGTLYSDNRGLDTDREAGEMLFIALGRNMNRMPAETVHVWWGRVAVWTADPGW